MLLIYLGNQISDEGLKVLSEALSESKVKGIYFKSMLWLNFIINRAYIYDLIILLY